MKYLIFIAVFWGLCPTAFSQGKPPVGVALTEFDPITMPVAIEVDSSIQLMVSEYVLSKSLKKQLGYVKKVEKVEVRSKDSLSFMVFSVRTPRMEQVLINIPLLKAGNGQYYAGSNAVTCSKSCGNCDGCKCDGSSSAQCGAPPGYTAYWDRARPLGRVSTQIE